MILTFVKMMNDIDLTKKECVNNEGTNSESEFHGSWNYLPDLILFQIFEYLTPRELINAGLTCKTWLRVCYDEFLWKKFVYSHFQIDHSISILPGKNSWLEEYKRLTYHIPVVQTEDLKDHTHEVLHVSFAHNGKLFATCSKDCSVLVWDSGYPAKIKYYKNMKVFCWKYTQFCQFNQSDTLLLVTGVHFSFPQSTSGETAVFSLQDGFNLQCRVVNKPYDIFGTWFSDHYLLSGGTHSLGSLFSASVLWLIRASQETESEHVPVRSQLGRFCNITGNSIRFVMVANCMSPSTDESDKSNAGKNSGELNEIKHSDSSSNKDINCPSISDPEDDVNELNNSKFKSLEKSFIKWKSLGEGLEYASPIYYNQEYREAEKESESNYLDSTDENMSEEMSSQSDGNNSVDLESEVSDLDNDFVEDDFSESSVEKLLIFTTGFKTCAPHQIGFKRIKPVTFPKRIDPGPSLAERIAERERKNLEPPRPEPEWQDFEQIAKLFDEADHLIDLDGHIIGMGLSPDHRYLYVNNRPWPQGCVIENPMHPPPIAQEIDIHVIDLVTLKEVGTMLRAHKAYTPNSECFYIFLNVSNEYVASGAEDRHGYLWDRHYGVCLAKYPHTDVVNSVAFNPKDSEMLVTTSDDYTIKIWRSKRRVKELKIENSDSLPRGLEMRFRKKKQKQCH